MNINGTYTLQATPGQIWSALMQKEVLTRVIPAIERLEQIDEELYAISVYVRQEPLSGSYRGRAKIVEVHYPTYFRFVIEPEGEMNTLSGEGSVYFQESEQNTIVSYQGDLQFGGQDADVSPLVMKGAAKLLVQEGFTYLAEQLRTERQSGIMMGNGHRSGNAVLMRQEKGDVMVIPAQQAKEQAPASFTHSLVKRLHLGEDDPVQEEMWVRRVQRTGIVAGLIFLVWVGTRLPRRR